MSPMGRGTLSVSRQGHTAVERLLRESVATLDPAPLFRRRLRSDVMNAWVASREGIDRPPRRRWLGRRMGALGRACLLASVALYASLASVMAASSQALPGEPLYAVKLRIEELRVEALPSQFQEELAVNALTERVSEMERLAAAGALDEALSLVPAIERQSAHLERLLESRGHSGSKLVESRLTVVARLADSLPGDLRAIVADLMPRPALAASPADAERLSITPREHTAPADRRAIRPAARDAEPSTKTLGPPADRGAPGPRDGRDADGESDEGGV